MRKILLCLSIILFNISIINAQCFKEIATGYEQSFGIKNDGTLWSWGWNKHGQLGDGTTRNKNYPVQMDSAKNWKSVVSSYGFTIAIKTDGSLWAWGLNDYGQLGIGTNINTSFPVQVGSSYNWSSVSLGFSYSMAIKTDGTLWGWGLDTNGILGDGANVNKKMPTQIGLASDWKSISCGGYHNLAIKTNGTLWAWGNNTAGALGDGTIINNYMPTQIGTLNNWKSCGAGLSHSVALKTDGTLWTWGNNNQGRLGDGTQTNRLSPSQIGSAFYWKEITVGFNHSIAIRSDGTLWGWGIDESGDLGQGQGCINTTSVLTPTQIGKSANWVRIESKFYHSFGLQDDGSLWKWGSNQYGELGEGQNSDYNCKDIPTFFSCPISTHTANKIKGEVFISRNSNCKRDLGENSIAGIVVLAKSSGYGAMTDSTGQYSINTDSGTYQISPIYPSFLKPFLKNLFCPNIGSYNVKFDSTAKDTSGFNFAQEVNYMPLLQVEFTQNRLRRCYDNSGTIKYCNLGTSDTDHVKVIVVLPPDVSYTSSSKTPSINGKTLTFDIGLLKAGECGTIDLVTSVDCINGLTEQTRCFKIGITPSNKTYKNLVNKPGFDNSMVSVEGTCLGSLINFSISNWGENMSDSSSYRIYKDGLLANNGKFKLVKNETKSIDIAATGHTYRLDADQSALYPTNSNPNASVENCGAGASSHLGFITKLPDYEENLEFKEHCIIIRDSYDPNEKSVTPSGIGAVHQVMHNAPLHFNINFQNTGNDTAYKVVIKDTLSKDFDLSTLLITGASHPYSIKFTGENATIINFIFDNIQLPDSTTNEKESHGFISYTITPQATIANGTAITNTADIYFDYNLPVRTNTTRTTIDDRWPITNEKLELNNSQNININPNPAKNKIRITNYELREGTKYLVYNTIGQIVLEGEIKEKTKIIDISSLESGIYFLNVNGNMKKFVVN